ncbi:DnaA N-terminal domain-containing protein [Buchnera aphidicola (Taiwanaphis decaspermi)]|uniref:DnaA N-terminal domain-containing protein n=1 Tax=Buchnera aphidicola TaxID=9 RepID=UPI0031B898D5
MSSILWKKCLIYLKKELPATEFSMWIRPIKTELKNQILILYTPNRFALDWVKNKYFNNISRLLNNIYGNNAPVIKFSLKNEKKNYIKKKNRYKLSFQCQ